MGSLDEMGIHTVFRHVTPNMRIVIHTEDSAALWIFSGLSTAAAIALAFITRQSTRLTKPMVNNDCTAAIAIRTVPHPGAVNMITLAIASYGKSAVRNLTFDFPEHFQHRATENTVGSVLGTIIF